MYHYINGEFLPETEAKIFLNDLAILRGYGIFDYFRTHKQKPILLDSYLSRFENSASIAHLKLPLKKEQIKTIIEKLIALNSYEEYGFRMILTGGYSSNAFSSLKPNFFIITEKFHPPDVKDILQGVNIISFEYQRDFPEAKLLNYSAAIIFSRNIKSKPFEILYYNQGKITEGSRCNFFMIKGKRLITAGEHILKGITRKTVLSLAKKDFEIEEVNFPINQLSSIDEAFITSSSKGILPVVKVDDLIIGNGKVGNGTSFLMQLYNNMLKDIY